MAGLKPQTVSIVIVNWNSGEGLRQCLASVVASRLSRVVLADVVVVDNASTDGSLRFDGITCPPIRLVENGCNLGFAAASNQGAARCDSDLLLFLNPDVVLERDSIDTAACYFSRPDAADVGIVGIALRDRTGSRARSCARFFTPRMMLADILRLDRLFPESRLSHRMWDWDHCQTREVNHVIGAFYMIRTTLFRGLGGFDERFFVYLEDLDLSARAAARGWRCVYLAEAGAFHAGCGCSRRVPVRRKLYEVVSRVKYARKHLGWYWLPFSVLSVFELTAFFVIFSLGMAPRGRTGSASV